MLRSAAESSNPGTNVFQVQQSGLITIGGSGAGNINFNDAAGTAVASFSSGLKTWAAAGTGGNMKQDSGSGGAYFTMRNYGIKIQDQFGGNEVIIKNAAGSPEGAFSTGLGSLVPRADGGYGTSFYVKENGAGATGYSPVMTNKVGADVGDAAKTLTVGTNEQTQIWATALTTARVVTLSTTGAYNGARFHIIRKAAATGASTLDIGTGPLKKLAPGQWAIVEYDGAAWFLAGSGNFIEPASAPTMGACGTSPSVVGNDGSFTVTTGTGGTATSCAVTFGTAFTNAPNCSVMNDTDKVSYSTVETTTGITINAAAAFTAGSKFKVLCKGWV